MDSLLRVRKLWSEVRERMNCSKKWSELGKWDFVRSVSIPRWKILAFVMLFNAPFVVCVCVCVFVYACVCVCACVCIYQNVGMHYYILTLVYVMCCICFARTHTHIHTNTHMHTHAHTHTQRRTAIWWNWRTRHYGQTCRAVKQKARYNGSLWEPGICMYVCVSACMWLLCVILM